MTKKTNKNFFGMTVTALNDRVVSCAHMEPIRGEQTFQDYIRKFNFSPRFPQLGKLFFMRIDKSIQLTYLSKSKNVFQFSILGKCYKAMTHESQFQDYFEFPSNDVEQMRATPYKERKCFQGNKCTYVDMEKSVIDQNSQEEYWYRVGIMGPQHIQTSTGVIFNTPRAKKRQYQWRNVHSYRYHYGRYQGTIIHRDDSTTIDGHPFFVVAEGTWTNESDLSYDAYVADPHWYDQTGASFAKGNFFKFNQDLEHFVVGAPNADRLQGRVYICHDCFGTKSKRNGRQLQAPNPQHGERFGAAVAAVDINGDGYDDVVVGAPLHNQLSTVLTNLPKMFFLANFAFL